MYKLRVGIAKARVEQMAEGVVSSYNHTYDIFIFGNHIDYRSAWIESLSEPKRVEVDRSTRIEASLIAYEFLFHQPTTFKCILKSKYHVLINTSIMINSVLLNYYEETHTVQLLLSLVQELFWQTKKFFWHSCTETMAGSSA